MSENSTKTAMHASQTIKQMFNDVVLHAVSNTNRSLNEKDVTPHKN